jgi:hypothetical protein
MFPAVERSLDVRQNVGLALATDPVSDTDDDLARACARTMLEDVLAAAQLARRVPPPSN